MTFHNSVLLVCNVWYITQIYQMLTELIAPCNHSYSNFNGHEHLYLYSGVPDQGVIWFSINTENLIIQKPIIAKKRLKMPKKKRKERERVTDFLPFQPSDSVLLKPFIWLSFPVHRGNSSTHVWKTSFISDVIIYHHLWQSNGPPNRTTP